MSLNNGKSPGIVFKVLIKDRISTIKKLRTIKPIIGDTKFS
ncbi:MAG: hypothetical protein QM668_15865 [Agriterribacter sp.]